MVTDNGLPTLSSTTRVVIEVEDLNDHTPEFDQNVYKIQIPANAIIDQPLFQVNYNSNLLSFAFQKNTTFHIKLVFLSL